ncbi:MAG: hypothetical protein HOC71_07630 [Candidatus Latescibacteria bacterium]|jgi:tetratricopeptide (TPR) repeat protein|nr:hypothetical protein [Candidatus Latescibacterota bacterium]
MKLLLKIVCLIVFSIVLLLVSGLEAAIAVTPAERFNEAGALYRDGQFSRALDIYEELIRSGIANPDLNYNASNAAFRAGFVGKAILHLERTLKLAPSDKDALSNLVYLNSIKKDQEPRNPNVVLAFLNRRYNAVNVNTAALWSGYLFVFSMVFATGALFMRKWKRMTLIVVSFLCGLGFAVSTGILIQKVHYASTVVEGIIMTEEASAYSGPSVENTHIFTIHEGTKITIQRTRDSWNLIKLKSGAGGWIKDELMEKI